MTAIVTAPRALWQAAAPAPLQQQRVLGTPGASALAAAIPAARRRPSRGKALRCEALGGEALVVQAVAWGGVLLYASSMFLGRQSQPEDGPPQRECENCSGTGFVECWCNRWSDNDGGCSTCRGSGRMVCSSCRGGGTAVPIQARIYIDNERTSTFKQNR